MSDLPEGWVNIPLGDLTTPTRPRRDPQAHPHLPYIGMEQVESHSRRLLGTVSATQMRSTAFHFQPRDILYGRLRPYLNKVFCADFEGLCSSEFIVLPPSATFEPKFLAIFLSTDGFVNFANGLNQGDRPRVRFDQVAVHEIPIPPLNEQRRIVAQLEELLGKVEACQKRLATIPVILKRFRQSVLAAACSGRLTADWREKNLHTESPSVMFEETKQSNTTDLPGSWVSVDVGLVIDNLKYGTAQKCGYTKEGVPVLRIPNIAEGVIDHSDVKYALLPKKEFEQLRLKPGDLLLIRSNGSVSLVGKSALIREPERGFAYAGYLIRLRPNRSRILPQYLNLALSSYDVRLQIEIPARSTSGVHNINSEELRGLRISLPPLVEQNEIVRRIEALFKFADQIEARYKKAQEQIDKLTQSILAKAFRGELVPTEAELARREHCDSKPG